MGKATRLQPDWISISAQSRSFGRKPSLGWWVHKGKVPRGRRRHSDHALPVLKHGPRSLTRARDVRNEECAVHPSVRQRACRTEMSAQIDRPLAPAAPSPAPVHSLHCSSRRTFKWHRAIHIALHVWMSGYFRRNRKPITNYILVVSGILVISGILGICGG